MDLRNVEFESATDNRFLTSLSVALLAPLDDEVSVRLAELLIKAGAVTVFYDSGG